MAPHHRAIVKTLQTAFQLQDGHYSQWLLAVCIQEESQKTFGSVQYLVRVLLMTSESSLIDGADLVITMKKDQALLNSHYYEGTPILQGSPILEAMNGYYPSEVP